LNVKLSEEQLEALRRYAGRRRTPISWLIKDYVEYLLRGGPPLVPDSIEGPTAMELAELVQQGGAFNWLADEPEIYSAKDGQAV
jgi:hypothetical protein